MKKVVDSIKPREKVEKKEDLLVSTGSTLLNLALTDKYYGGIRTGTVVRFAGQHSAGKTMLAETILAEAANDLKFDAYRLYLDNTEFAQEMNIRNLFGDKAADRIYLSTKQDNSASVTVEELSARISLLIKEEIPFIYCIDSTDGLTSAVDINAQNTFAEEYQKLTNAGKDTSALQRPGSYRESKPKEFSALLQNIKGGLEATNSIVIFISQIRSNFKQGFAQPEHRTAGGDAIDFYASQVVWLSIGKTLTAEGTLDLQTKKKASVQEIVGRSVHARVKKNKYTGKIRNVNFPIYYDYGIDDITSCVEALLEWGALEQSGAWIDASILEYKDKLYKKDLIKAIENDGKVELLRKVTGEIWKKKEEVVALDRKPRYS